LGPSGPYSATRPPKDLAADSIDHLRRYIEMLFGVGTEQAKHLTDGDSK